MEKQVAGSWLERTLLFIQQERRQLKKTHSLIIYVVILAFFLLGITTLVYINGGAETALPHIFYIPIVITGIIKGWVWGGVTGLVSGLLCGPLMASDVNAGVMQPAGNWMLRAAFFLLLGLFLELAVHYCY